MIVENELILDVYTFCYNEEIRLKYFLELYAPISRKITIFDNGSTDKSKEIAQQYENVIWDGITYNVGEQHNLIKQKITNNCWELSRDSADLVIACDADEFLYHKNGLINFFEEKLNDGYNIFKATAYEMVSEVAPVHNGQIYDDKNFQKGFRIDIKTYDKCMIWSPKHINKMHFEAGCHKHQAIPFEKYDIKICEHEDLKMLHYNMGIGRENWLSRSLDVATRFEKQDQDCPVTDSIDKKQTDLKKLKGKFQRNLEEAISLDFFSKDVNLIYNKIKKNIESQSE